MKQIILIFLIQMISFSLSAHKHGHGTPSKTWELEKEGEIFQADFIKEKDGIVYLSDKNHSILGFNIKKFSQKDQQYISDKSNWIQTANTTNESNYSYLPNFTQWFIIAGLFMILFSIFLFVKRGLSLIMDGMRTDYIALNL